MNSRLIKIAAALTVAAAVALGGAAWAIAGGGDDEGPGATGPAADRARAAAVAHVGGGKATEVEQEGENGGVWEVEVTKTDGTSVEVNLDANYGIVGVGDDSAQDDGADDQNESQNESGDN